MRVLVKGPLTHRANFGVDTLELVKALVLFGAEVHLQPTSTDPPLPGPIASLLTKAPSPRYDLLVHVGILEDLVPSHDTADVKLAWTSYPNPHVPLTLNPPQIAKDLNSFDGVLVHNSLTQQTLSSIGVSSPLLVLPPGFDSSQFRSINRQWQGPWFAFSFIGLISDSSSAFTVLEAFKDLKTNSIDVMQSAELNILTPSLSSDLTRSLESYAPGVTVVSASYNPTDLNAFYARQHVLICPSGHDLSSRRALEFMSTGGVVAAPNYGCHTSWLSSQYAYVLDLTEDNHPYVTREQLSNVMLRAYSDRALSSRKALTAQQVAPQMCSWPSTLDRLFLLTSDAIPGKGSQLRAKASFCQPLEPDQGGPSGGYQ